MILFDREITWTPIRTGKSLGIALRRDFADACMACEKMNQSELTEAVWRSFHATGVAPSGLFVMKDGILPSQFHAGHDGLWLSINTMMFDNPERPVMYDGHNADTSSVDREWLEKVFGAWATVAALLVYGP